jgi:hypothetical protein
MLRSSLRLMMTGLIALGAVHPAASQPAQGTSVETGEPRPLTPDKQKMILDQVKRSTDLPQASLSGPIRIGMTIPPEVELLGLPQDAATIVPTVTTYNYLIVGDQIAIIEPETRKVIQLIKR